jgi:putative transposase
MRGVTLAVFLEDLHITRSYSRPRCSNDNAFIESWHKTLKYTVGYPKYFTDLKHARSWFADFVQWYNSEHLHSSLGYVTPLQMRSGEALKIYERRNQTIEEAMKKNPRRWISGHARKYSNLPVMSVFRPMSMIA